MKIFGYESNIFIILSDSHYNESVPVARCSSCITNSTKNPKVEECEQDEERALRAKPKEAAQGHESPWGSL